jgi:lipoate-protein ligase A
MNGKQKKMLHWIKDTYRNAVMNMAIDEALFSQNNDASLLRTYHWDSPYTTIGYFQKSKDASTESFVRRFTGGLTVNHHHDLSYCFITSSKYWNVYDQNETYMLIHLAIKKALEKCNVYTEMLYEKANKSDNICVNTFYTNDLILEDKKIVGSCLRRRGTNLIVQGSVHVRLGSKTKELFSNLFAKNLAFTTNENLTEAKLNKSIIQKALIIAKEKYSNPKWNNKY